MLKDIATSSCIFFSEDELEDPHLNHEDNKVYEKRFRRDVTQLYEELKGCGNPLTEDGEDLENINSKCIIMSPASSASVRNALNIGLQAYDKFCDERLVSGKNSIYDTISQNKLLSFCQKKHKHPQVN